MAPKKDGAASGAAATGVEEQLHAQTRIREGLESFLPHLHSKISDLESTVGAKLRDREDIKKDFVDFRAYASTTISRHEGTVEELKRTLADVRAQGEADLAACATDLTAQLTAARHEAAVSDRALRAELFDLKRKDALVAEYLAAKDGLEREVAELRATLASEREGFTERLAELERNAVVAAEVRRKEQDANWMELKRLARVEAAKNMTEEQKATIELNRAMVVELKAHTSETKLLAGERTSLVLAKAGLARDVALLRDAEREWASRGGAQARDIKSLSARLREVEEAFLAERTRSAGETETLINDFEAESDELRRAVFTLRELLELKDREVRTVKRLASIVLQQRTEVEQLLLDALHGVKGEVAARKAGQAAAVEDAAQTVNTVLTGALAPTPIAPTGSPAKLFSTAVSLARRDPHVVGLSVTPLCGSRALPAGVPVTLTALVEAAPPASAPRVPGVDNAPPLKPSSSSSGAGAGGDGASVDYTELTHEDRERVLSLLLHRIRRVDAGAAVVREDS